MTVKKLDSGYWYVCAGQRFAQWQCGAVPVVEDFFPAGWWPDIERREAIAAVEEVRRIVEAQVGP